jgi:ABC-type uncharacterized transport system permease subunit
MDAITWIDSSIGIYLDNKIQAHHIFDLMISELQTADELVISSFAITEAWVRRLIRNKEKLNHIILVLDFTVASRKARNTDFAAQNVNELYLTKQHSKTIYMRSGNRQLLALISNNATNNQRFESGVVFRDHPAINVYLQKLETVKKESAIWRI